MGKESRRNNSQDLVAQQVMQDKMVRNLERENRYLEALLKNYEVRDQLKAWIPLEPTVPAVETHGQPATTSTVTLTGVSAFAEAEAAV